VILHLTSGVYISALIFDAIVKATGEKGKESKKEMAKKQENQTTIVSTSKKTGRKT
jgi:hypothetical protein